MRSLNTSERFAALFQRAKESPTYRIEGLKVEITEHIYLAMQREQISNAELARRLGKSRAYVTKVLSGNVNFTLETLVMIADALNYELKFDLSPKASAQRWEGISAHQPILRRVNWRDQNYLRLLDSNTSFTQPKEEENNVSVAAAA